MRIGGRARGLTSSRRPRTAPRPVGAARAEEAAILPAMSRTVAMLRVIPLGALLWGAGCAGAVASHATDAAAPAPGSAEERVERTTPTGVAPDPVPAEVAEPTEAPTPAGPGGAAPGLDALLTLPGDRTYTVERRGGLSQGEWGARFAEARRALADEKAALEAAEARMDQAAESGQWQVAPPIPGQQTTGAPAETTLDFKTRQEIRRHRDEIERLERRLREVEIEANLAAVPPEWRQ